MIRPAKPSIDYVPPPVQRPSRPGETRLGAIIPRIWTPPLVVGPPGPCGCGCALTPETSYGFAAELFARDVLNAPLMAHQRWLAIHIGELLPDGRPRFRQVLVMIARQNGKTHLLMVLILFWMFVEKRKWILGMSTDRTYAKDAWREAHDLASEVDALTEFIPPRSPRDTNGSEDFFIWADPETKSKKDQIHYRFAANNRRAGRSMTLDRLVVDELREHRKFEAWDSAKNATNKVYDAQIVAITNQGDNSSVVLDSLRDPALTFIEKGEGDERLGIFEYSAPVDMEPDELEGILYANPMAGWESDVDALLADARRAKRAGGDQLTGFRTEVLCQRVTVLNPAVDPGSWRRCGTDDLNEWPDFTAHRSRVAVCLDIAQSEDHATLTAALTLDEVTYVEVIESWDGHGCTAEVRRNLPSILARVRPRTLGWFPQGAAAALAASMTTRRRDADTPWPPRGCKIVPITADTPAVCMGFAEQVRSIQIRHVKDPLLDAHIGASQKHEVNKRFVFVRVGVLPIDAAYSAAGAVHLSRIMKAPPPALAT